MRAGQRAQDQVYIRCALMCCHAHRQADGQAEGREGNRIRGGVGSRERKCTQESFGAADRHSFNVGQERGRGMGDGGWEDGKMEDGDTESERCGHCFDAGTRWCSRLPAPCGTAGAKQDVGTRQSGLAVSLPQGTL